MMAVGPVSILVTRLQVIIYDGNGYEGFGGFIPSTFPCCLDIYYRTGAALARVLVEGLGCRSGEQYVVGLPTAGFPFLSETSRYSADLSPTQPCSAPDAQFIYQRHVTSLPASTLAWSETRLSRFVRKGLPVLTYRHRHRHHGGTWHPKPRRRRSTLPQTDISFNGLPLFFLHTTCPLSRFKCLPLWPISALGHTSPTKPRKRSTSILLPRTPCSP